MTVDFRDNVSNIVSGVIGIVDAIYTKRGIIYVDVIVGEKMYYESPVTNWTVMSKCNE